MSEDNLSEEMLLKELENSTPPTLGEEAAEWRRRAHPVTLQWRSYEKIDEGIEREPGLSLRAEC
jgi:hypothetical protein